MGFLPSTQLVGLWSSDGWEQLYWDVPVELEANGDCPLTILYAGDTWDRCSGPPQNPGYWYKLRS